MTYRIAVSRLAAGLAASLLISACGNGSDHTRQPENRQDGRNDGRAAPARPDPARIPGLEVVSDSGNDPRCPWYTSYPDVPGAKALTDLLAQEVSGLRDTFLRASPGDNARACAEDLGGAELNVSFDILVASGDVLGVRLTSLDGSAASSDLTTRTVWYDGATGRAVPASGLVSDDALTDLAELATQELTGREAIDTGDLDDVLQDVDATDGAVFADLSFTEKGDLVADFAKGTVATPAAGPQQVVIARAAADPLLSDLGSRAQRQTTDPDGRLDLGAGGAGELSTNELSPLPDLLPVDCAQARCVALTFDDGPGQYTERLLGMLAEHDAQATFYVVGQNAEARPEVLSQQAAAGHEVQNHTWSHPDLTTLTRAERRSQIDRTSAAIENATGQQPTQLRPPYGAWNKAVRRQAGLPLVLWSVDPEDWKYRDSDRVADHVLSTTRPGDIVLLHDIHQTTVDAVPAILEGLSEQGYHFVTVSELFGEPLEDGEVYRRNEAAYGR